ncbi:MAG: DNA primase [Planctomycetota bacterium]
MSGFIPEHVINRVRDSVDIVDLISRYLSLKKTGSSFKALCPFHKEKTPSFNVSPSRQIFKCFGCGKGGNCFHFLMEMEGMSFPEAVRTLARDVGVEVPERTRSEVDEAAKDVRTKLYDANRRAAAFFTRMLQASSGDSARDYLEQRGINQEMVERCGLGYAPDSWDALLTAAGTAGFRPDDLAAAGLVIKREDGTGYYDRFRDRLMFPIFDTQDRVVGFGARALGDDQVKYLNTPETPVFNKGRQLYGLNWARPAIVKHNRAAVVEGYTDVIMAHQHGCEAVVATLGTALTRSHIRLLRRFAERIDVVFDADTAGQLAAERSMELFLGEGAGALVAAGFDVRIATVEGGKDPCDLIVDQGAEAFQRTLDAAVDVFTKKIEIAAERHETDTIEGKTKAVDDVLELVARIPNAVGRELRVDAVSELISRRFGLVDRVVRARLAQIERRTRRGSPAEDEPRRAPTLESPAESTLLEAALASPQTLATVVEQLEPSDFENAKLRQLFEAMRHHYERAGAVNASQLLSNLADADLASLVAGAAQGPARPGLEQTAPDCIRALLKRRKRRRMNEIKDELSRARASGDETRANELSIQYLNLQREVLAS